MLTNGDITLYNRLEDDTWRRQVIRGIWHRLTRRISPNQRGYSPQHALRIRIPANADTQGAGFVPAPLLLGQSGWTLQTGDRLVLGISQSPVPPIEGAFTITEWVDNRQFGRGHFRIGAE